jgi:hypothetical protein
VIPATRETDTEIGRPKILSQKQNINKTQTSETLSQKQKENKRTGSVAQMVEHLPSRCEALGST